MSSFSATGRSQRTPAASASTTLDFAETTDADGQAVPDPDDLKKDYQWIAIARGKEGRLAFLGFETIWWSDRSDDAVYDQNKAFAITDRPVYRPGQAREVQVLGRAMPATTRPRPPGLPARNSRSASPIRGAKPRWRRPTRPTLTAASTANSPFRPTPALGEYSLAIVDRNDVYGGAAFRVEEYKKPEFEVKVDAPQEPARLGDKVTATIRATYYFGGPVTQATVHYKVIRTGHDRALVSLRNLGLAVRPGILVVLARLHLVSRLECLGLLAAGFALGVRRE